LNYVCTLKLKKKLSTKQIIEKKDEVSFEKWEISRHSLTRQRQYRKSHEFENMGFKKLLLETYFCKIRYVLYVIMCNRYIR